MFKVDEYMTGSYTEYEISGDIFFKQFSFIDYLHEIKKYLASVINKLNC